MVENVLESSLLLFMFFSVLHNFIPSTIFFLCLLSLAVQSNVRTYISAYSDFILIQLVCMLWHTLLHYAYIFTQIRLVTVIKLVNKNKYFFYWICKYKRDFSHLNWFFFGAVNVILFHRLIFSSMKDPNSPRLCKQYSFNWLNECNAQKRRLFLYFSMYNSTFKTQETFQCITLKIVEIESFDVFF